MSNQAIKELIKRKRGQMLVHSFLYYSLDDPIWTDDKWQQVADELTRLQEANPSCCKIGFYDKEFLGWTGDTGMHLPKHILVEQLALKVKRANDAFNKGQYDV